MIPSKYTEKNLPTRALKQLIHVRRKSHRILRVPGNSVCRMALLGQRGNENWFSVNCIFIILINSILIRKYFKLHIFMTGISNSFVFVF